MGPGVAIFAANYGIVEGEPMTFQKRREASITIGDDVWLGAHSVITAGTSIANGVVVAAGAVVTRSISEEGVIVGGIPAKVIGKRPPATSESRVSIQGDRASVRVGNHHLRSTRWNPQDTCDLARGGRARVLPPARFSTWRATSSSFWSTSRLAAPSSEA
jgi:Hexapeptide repeat of succinyl-transferase